MKNREADTIITAWTNVHSRLKNNGIVTKHYILDNECSTVFKNALQDENNTFELVPPHQHCRNAAERAIRTFKNHFLAGLVTCHPDFPLREWDRLLLQAEITIHLLRNSRMNPKLSAWAYLFRVYNFNLKPLLPPGTKIIIHAKPGQRASWAFHGEQGWYVGPAINHYRCLTAYMSKTHKEQITDTATIIPKNIPIPHATLNDHPRRTADDLIHLLGKNTNQLFSSEVPLSSKGALLDIAKLLHRDTTPKFSPLPIASEASAMTSEGEVVKTLGKSQVHQKDSGKSQVHSDKLVSSEGGSLLAHPDDTIKRTITPITTLPTNIHPALYKIPTNHIHPNTVVENNTSSKLKKITPMSIPDSIDKLIAKYKHIPKKKKKQQKVTRNKLSPPRVHKSYVPIPKGYKSSQRTSQEHPMLLRRRYDQTPSFKHRAAEFLAQNMIHTLNHIFNINGQKETIDTLLKKHPNI